MGAKLEVKFPQGSITKGGSARAKRVTDRLKEASNASASRGTRTGCKAVQSGV